MCGPDRHARAAALLNSPLGTFVVATLVARRHRSRGFTPLELPPDARQVDGRAYESDPAVLYELVLKCVVHLSPYAPDYGDRVRALAARAPALWEDALRLVSSRAAESWFADLQRTRQVWISPANSTEVPDRSRFGANLSPFGGGIPKPRAALWTATTVGSMPGGWSLYLRIGEDQRPPPYRLWRLEALPSARVYEVHGPDDWRALCGQYPGDIFEGRLLPDWQAVARDWDGVHLSIGGLLTTQRVAVDTGGRRAQLDSWDSESTVWLRWSFGRVERLPDAVE
jgi:hypothetical protein